ncbi:MAG: glycosyltransferase family 2 protein [Clostridiales bacterium]|nr:glycosyltransferase family 2 protein [Clostridiales bacterium]
MDDHAVKVTVFTPTYNRCALIPRLYASLCRQTDMSFEWVVVDQGQDDTEMLVKGYAKEAPFPVVYRRITGERGIGRAMNDMLGVARGELMLKVDDDDILTDDAIQAVLEMERTLEHRDGYAGVSGLKVYPDNKTIGGEWTPDAEWIDCTNLERDRYHLESDKAEAYYLRVLRQYGPIPTVPGEYYTWEAVLWDRIAHAGLKIRWFNRKIYIAEYLPGGATDSEIAARSSNFGTFTIYVSERLLYKEIPFIRRLILSCRYFELFRQKGLPVSEINRTFSGTMPMALLGYFGSLATRHIARRAERHVPIKEG